MKTFAVIEVNWILCFSLFKWDRFIISVRLELLRSFNYFVFVRIWHDIFRHDMAIHGSPPPPPEDWTVVQLLSSVLLLRVQDGFKKPQIKSDFLYFNENFSLIFIFKVHQMAFFLTACLMWTQSNFDISSPPQRGRPSSLLSHSRPRVPFSFSVLLL